MFPLTHIATAKAVLEKENVKTVLGSVFPDFVTYLGIGRNLGHELGHDLYAFCSAYYPEDVDFALGVLSHGTSLPGVDTYADERYQGKRPGFCFQEGAKIARDVARYCHVPPQMALWKAHNFIEIAFDVITARLEPDLEARALKYVYPEEIPVLPLLHHYLNLPQAHIEAMFREVPHDFCFEGTNVDLMVRKFLQSLERRHGITGGDFAKSRELVERAVAIVEPQYADFTAEMQSNLKRDFAAFPKVWDE